MAQILGNLGHKHPQPWTSTVSPSSAGALVSSSQSAMLVSLVKPSTVAVGVWVLREPTYTPEAERRVARAMWCPPLPGQR